MKRKNVIPILVFIAVARTFNSGVSTSGKVILGGQK